MKLLISAGDRILEPHRAYATGETAVTWQDFKRDERDSPYRALHADRSMVTMPTLPSPDSHQREPCTVEWVRFGGHRRCAGGA
jgi:hypothetical protein